MRLRHVSVAALIACGLLTPVVTTPAIAAGPAKLAASPVKATKPATPSKPATASKPATPVKPGKPVKPVKPVKFAASGVVDAVDTDARTITVKVKGGANDLRGTTITFSVAATARVTVNDAPATLAEVQTGQRANVQGDKVGSVYTAVRITTSTPQPQPSPSTTPEPSPTA